MIGLSLNYLDLKLAISNQQKRMRTGGIEPPLTAYKTDPSPAVVRISI